MPKLSREKRKERSKKERNRALRAMAVATTAAAILAITMPQGNETAQALPDQPVAAEVATERPPSEPPASGVVSQSLRRREPAPERAAIEQLDSERVLDHAIRDCFTAGLISEESIRMMFFSILGLDDLLRRPYWARALEKIQVLNGIWMWKISGARRIPTHEGKELWSLFRMRMRLEGAHLRIADGTIDPRVTPKQRRRRFTQRAA
jgi:hypothetical protein